MTVTTKNGSTQAQPDRAPGDLWPPILQSPTVDLTEAIRGAGEALRYLEKQDGPVDTSTPPFHPLALAGDTTSGSSVRAGQTLPELITAALDSLQNASGGHGGFTVGLVANPTSGPQLAASEVSQVSSHAHADGYAALTGAAAPTVGSWMTEQLAMHPQTVSEHGQQGLQSLQAAGVLTQAETRTLSRLHAARDRDGALERAAKAATSPVAQQIIAILQELLDAAGSADQDEGPHPLLDKSDPTEWEVLLNGCFGGGGIGAAIGGAAGGVPGAVAGAVIGCAAGAAGAYAAHGGTGR